MGRFEKTILEADGTDRRELGYYSTPDFIARFMTTVMLELNPNGSSALDPCVGKEELIKHLYDQNIEVDGIDIFNHGDYFYCNFIQADFINFYKKLKIKLLFDQQINLKYDYYIANPPYNCHEVDYIRSNKKELGKLFGNIGVHNMYSMFVSSIIDCAKDGALISIISADSFLTAKMYNSLRKQILESCSLHYLALCPTDLFRKQKADVRTCIMILQKGKHYQGAVKTLNRPKNKVDLHTKLEKRDFVSTNLQSIVNYSSDKGCEFIIDVPTEIQSLFHFSKLGEKYKCITGISTGDDSKYISKEKKKGFEIPFFKNPGLRKFYCEADGYITDDYLQYGKEIKNFVVRNKSFILKEGITCSSMGLPFSACYLPEGSTFGVNANIFCDKSDLWWLLGYLNSSLVTYIVRGVLNRSNMITSGYISKIPIVELKKETKKKIQVISKKAHDEKISTKNLASVIKSIDDILFTELNFSKEVQKEVLHFSNNLQSRV